MHQSVQICTILIVMFYCSSCKEETKNSVAAVTNESSNIQVEVPPISDTSTNEFGADTSLAAVTETEVNAELKQNTSKQPFKKPAAKDIQRKLSQQNSNASQQAAPEKAKKVKTISHPDPSNPINTYASSELKPAIAFKELVHDFEEITEGDVIDHKFMFKNIGNAPLEILGADVSCGCTTPSFPFLAIAPGETGFIGVSYNSVGKSGEQKPQILITTNVADAPIELYFSGNVIDKPKKKVPAKTEKDTTESEAIKVIDKASEKEAIDKEQIIPDSEEALPEIDPTDKEESKKGMKIFKRKKGASN